MNTIVKENLLKVYNSEPPKFTSSFIDIKIKGTAMEAKSAFTLPPQSKAYTLEAIWGCSLVFTWIALKDLIWIFTALMLERKLVFLSKNVHLLTATLSVIRSLTKPFKYPFPLIFNLPEVLMVMCDAPGAALIGI